MPSVVTIYHNPRCSKSRQTLELLRSKEVELKVIEYLQDPPDETTIEKLLGALGVEPIDLIRKNEEPYKTLGLDKKASNRKALIRAMAEHPILIERPIVIKGGTARIGRPPERVLEIL